MDQGFEKAYSGNLLKITSYYGHDIHMISQNDGLPQYICVLCRHELDISISFKDKCETTFKMLKEQYNKEIEVKENIILNLLSGGNAFGDKLPEQARKNILNTVKNSVRNDVKSMIARNNSGPKNREYILEMGKATYSEQNNDKQLFSKNYRTHMEIMTGDQRDLEDQMIVPDDQMTTVTDADDQMTDITESEFEMPESLQIKDQDLMCTKCNFCFVNDGCLFDHMKRMHPKTMGQCQICLMYFPTSQQLKDHLRTKHDVSDDNYDLENRCKVCNRTFDLQAELNTHLCSSPEKFLCELCQLNFQLEADLESHIKFVHQQVEFVCELCNKMFSGFDTYRSHLKEHSNVNKKISLTELLCPECNTWYLSHGKYNKHGDSCHAKKNDNEKEKSHSHKSANISVQLRAQHRNFNKGIRSHVCSICRMLFQKKSSLESHLLEHDNLIKCTKEEIYISCD